MQWPNGATRDVAAVLQHMVFGMSPHVTLSPAATTLPSVNTVLHMTLFNRACSSVQELELFIQATFKM